METVIPSRCDAFCFIPLESAFPMRMCTQSISVSRLCSVDSIHSRDTCSQKDGKCPPQPSVSAKKRKLSIVPKIDSNMPTHTHTQPLKCLAKANKPSINCTGEFFCSLARLFIPPRELIIIESKKATSASNWFYLYCAYALAPFTRQSFCFSLPRAVVNSLKWEAT